MKAPNPLDPQGNPFSFQDFKDGLKRLESALKQGPCYALLLGESGTGKTTLLRTLYSNLDPQKYHIIYLCHGRPSPSALANVLAHTFHLPVRYTRAETSRMLHQTLRNLPTKLLLWIDEAQMMPDDTLHEIRLLSEADLMGPPLFSVILSGLPTLKDKLLNPTLFPLWRRIHPKIYLNGLLRQELTAYVEHRFGKKTTTRFTEEILLMLFEHSRGIPAVLDLFISECLKPVKAGPIPRQTVSEIIETLEIS